MSSPNAQNNKRIAKNTMMLYVRMLFSMLVSLYTSRVILENLGIEDYGIYNVVGGVVSMFTMISSSLSGSISRFITFELGKGNQQKLNIIFSTSVIIQIILGIIIAILVETVGIWFLTHKMIIPIDRIFAAKWVMQFSLITLIINLISIPYNATIVAHEKMSAFAYISILEVTCKLAIAYLITISPIDNLIFYAILMSMVALIVRLTYGIYCKRHFEECKQFRFVFDKAIFKEMFGFAGWSFIGDISVLLRDQGGNILLNLFGGPAINAARGISLQVRAAITNFSTNFIVALRPQITKSYATGDRDYMMTLVFQGARLSYYLLLMLSAPILLNTNCILSLWLKVVPDHAVLFTQLALILVMVDSISQPLVIVMSATGKIRDYQIVVGGMSLLNLPISYLLLKIGLFPEVVILVAIFIAICCLALRLYMLKSMVDLPVIQFLKNVVLNILAVSVISISPVFLLTRFVSESFVVLVLVTIVSLLWTSMTIYFVGCKKTEKEYFNKMIMHFFYR